MYLKLKIVYINKAHKFNFPQSTLINFIQTLLNSGILLLKLLHIPKNEKNASQQCCLLMCFALC